jgi:hypothetical protein
MLLTADEVNGVRARRASVNHETYKVILQRVYDRIRHQAAMNRSDLAYALPAIVPGRPVYDAAHAMRYVTDKLRLGGFEVATDGPMIYASWKPARQATPVRDTATTPKKPKPKKPRAAPAAKSTPGDLSRRLEILKYKLDL